MKNLENEITSESINAPSLQEIIAAKERIELKKELSELNATPEEFVKKQKQKTKEAPIKTNRRAYHSAEAPSDLVQKTTGEFTDNFPLPEEDRLNNIFYSQSPQSHSKHKSYSFTKLQLFGQAILKPIEVLSLSYSFSILPNDLSLINKLTIEIAANAAYAAFIDVRDASIYKHEPLSGLTASGGGNTGLGFTRAALSKGIAVGAVCLANYGVARLLMTFPVESLDEDFRNFLNNDRLRTPAFTAASFLTYKSFDWVLNRLLKFAEDQKEEMSDDYNLSLGQKITHQLARLNDDILVSGSILIYTNAYGYSVLTNNPLLAMAIINVCDVTLETIRNLSYCPHPINDLISEESCLNQVKAANSEESSEQEIYKSTYDDVKDITFTLSKKLGWKILVAASTMYFGTLDACDELKLDGCQDDYTITWAKIFGAVIVLEFGKDNVPSCETIKSTTNKVWNLITSPVSKFYGSLFSQVKGVDKPLIPDDGLEAAPTYGAIN